MRVSLLVGVVAGVCSSLIGTAAGTLAGTWGGRVDQVICRLIDSASAVPQLLLGILLVALFRPSVTAVVASVVKNLHHQVPERGVTHAGYQVRACGPTAG